MNSRRMTFLKLARVCWPFWFWGGLVGANVGCAIGEAFGYARVGLLALNVIGAAASLVMAATANQESSRRIEEFYAQQHREAE